MPTFVRFIFLMLIIGIAMNVAIVSYSDYRTREKQVINLAEERKNFALLVKAVNKQLRRGEIAVEWQRIDANQKVIETSLLVRQFMPVQNGPAIPLASIRIVIPGDRVCIDGLELEFDSLFNEEYAELRDTTLFQFDHIYADGTPVLKQFTFLTPYEVPPATAVSSTAKDPRPTFFENKLWESVWVLISNPHPEKRGLKVTHMTSACSIVKAGSLYQITAGLEGVTITEEDEGFNHTHRDQMLEEGQRLK